MKTQLIILISFISFVLFSSCKQNFSSYDYKLNKAGEEIAFALDEDTKSFSRATFLYTDNEGKEYLTFQNNFMNDLVFYDFETRKFAFRMKPEMDGKNGIGKMFGYYIAGWDSIYLTNNDIEEIAIIDTACILKEQLVYNKTIDDISLTRSPAFSYYYRPMYKIANKLYVVSSCNRKSKVNPISFTIDLETKEVKHLPFEYPKLQIKMNPAKTAGIENRLSRVFDGEKFIYSFSYEEDIYIASIDHKMVTSRKVKSKYIKEVKTVDDYGNFTIKDMCEHAEYGNLLYDQYRKVYYRIVFPQTEILKKLNDREYLDLMHYGRKCFSIIILDADFNIIGETLFPDYTYNPTMAFIREDGLYLSASHAFNENYSDDWLKFQRFELVKE